MPIAQYSSFDRGFDLGHVDVEPARAPVIERRFVSKAPSRDPLKKILAMCLIGVMIISGITLVVPMLAKQGSPVQPSPVDNQIGGSPETTWTISNLFENYLKPTDYSKLGRHNTTMGWNEWWDVRSPTYYDTKVRAGYPFTMMYSYYSANIPTAVKDPRMGFGIYSFYRLSIDANNISAVSTGSGKDIYFLPILAPGGLAMSGGWVNWTYYITYLTSQECSDITAGSHYANTYYGVPTGAVSFSGSLANDGWWTDLQGKVDFNRQAAAKYLNLAGAGSLITQFDNANVGNALGLAWASEWSAEGSSGGAFNIYATYDYTLDYVAPYLYLTRDPASTADKLVLRFWGTAWGYETLMERYLEGLGIAKYHQGYPEDVYINGTASPTNGDVEVREVLVYKMLAWKDTGTWAPAWNIDTSHSDGCPSTAGWNSRYNGYDVIPRVRSPNKMEYGPGTVNYGTRVMYWQPYQGYNLSAGQKLVVKLGNQPTLGYEPYKGASDQYYGAGAAAKIAELATHQVWGELVLGHGFPLTGALRLNQSAFYNHATKTMTLVGPLNFNSVRNQNPTFPALNETGSPNLMFAVSKVSTYDVQIVGASPPYAAGQSYNLQVTARNFTGVAISNGSVQLESNNPGTTFGATQHTYLPGENGVWSTTVVFGSVKANTYVNASSTLFPLDVNGVGGAWQVDTVIPEFSVLMMPVFMIAIAVAVIAGRRRKVAK